MKIGKRTANVDTYNFQGRFLMNFNLVYSMYI